MPKFEAARAFGVGISSLKRYVATYRQGSFLLRRSAPPPPLMAALDEEELAWAWRAPGTP
jgi:transposase